MSASAPNAAAASTQKRSVVDVHLMCEALNQGFPSNTITTSKYTILSFLPLNLMEQFRRVSNFYFLIVMICTLIPGATSINPYSAVVPFMFVLAVAAVKDGYEDYKRHKADRAANAMPVQVLRNGEFTEVASKDIVVGDIIRFGHGEEIRADALILATSLPDGLAYIETANLDGETNAKTRKASSVTVEHLGTKELIASRCARRVIDRGGPVTAFASTPRTSPRSPRSGGGGRGVPRNTMRHSVLEAPHDASGGRAAGTGPGPQLPQFLTCDGNAQHRRTPSDQVWSAIASENEHEGGGGGSDLANSPNLMAAAAAAVAAGGGGGGSRHEPDSNQGDDVSTNAHHRIGSGQHDDSNNGVKVVCGAPNPNLALWHGKLHMPDGSIHPLGIDQFIPRGCVLRNTEWIICAALYTGNETKMMLNLKKRPMKQSIMEQKVNKMNVFLFAANQSMILLFCGLALRFRFQNIRSAEDGNSGTADGHHGMWYVRYRMEEFSTIATYFWRYLNLFALVSYLIPLSLYVSLEFVKATQITYIARDDKMAVEMPNGELRYPRPKTSNLNVQLAHVRYIFTDKTGTLTENMMKFVGGYVGGKLFNSVEVPGGLGLELVETVHPTANLDRLPPPASATTPPSSAHEPTSGGEEEDERRRHQPPPSAAEGGAFHVTGAAFTQTVNDMNQSVLSVMLDEKGDALLPKDICMRFNEADISSMAVYRYLLSLALCHNVVCFDNDEHNARPLKKSASTASGRKKKKSFVLHARTMSGIVGSTGGGGGASSMHHSRVHSRTLSGVGGGVGMSRAHSRTFSGGGGAVHSRMPTAHDRSMSSNVPGGAGMPPRSLSHGNLVFGAHKRTVSKLGALNGDPVFRANPKRDEKIYEGQSLDEVALVKAARENGFELLHRSLRQIVVDVFGTPMVYDIIAELEFTPQRKLMSIILKRNPSSDAAFQEKCRSNIHQRSWSYESFNNAATTTTPSKGKKSQQLQLQRTNSLHTLQPSGSFASPPPHVVQSPMGSHANRRATFGQMAEFPRLEVDGKAVVGGPTATTTGSGAQSTTNSGRALKSGGSGGHETAGDTAGGGQIGMTSPNRRDPFALGGTSGREHHHHEHHMQRAASQKEMGSRNPTSHSINSSNNNPTPHPPHHHHHHHAHAENAFRGSGYLMLTKGADSAMFAALDASVMYNQIQKPECEVALSEMASTGLRTLVLGYRSLTAAEVDAWLPVYNAAQTAEDREGALHTAYAQIEQNLTLIGTTAVEDKLQDGVPETLAFLLDAEIVIWMLTGDKRETAVTIAATSGLMDPTKDITFHLDVSQMPLDDDNDVEAATQETIRQLDAARALCEDPQNRVVLVIDGLSLQHILKDHERTALFFRVGSICRSAVCCRMTPLQKADIVKLFQENTQGVALAIGDGANDVSMILESRIGIGIMGLEGAQAELASDFAIPKFRHLKRLLVVHGRNALYRESQCILYSIYKNVVLTCTLATYCYYTAYTGVAMMDSWTLAMWNVFFVSIPPLLLGIFDKDVDDELAETHPQLYPPLAKEDMYMNLRALITWLGDGCAHGFFIFLLIMVAVGRDALHPFRSEPMEQGGFTIYINMVILCNVQAIGAIQLTNVFNVGGMILSFVVVAAFTMAQSSMVNLGGATEMYQVASDTYQGVHTYIYLVFFNAGLLTVWNVTRKYLLRYWWPENNTLQANTAAHLAWSYAKKRWRSGGGTGVTGGNENGDDPNSVSDPTVEVAPSEKESTLPTPS